MRSLVRWTLVVALLVLGGGCAGLPTRPVMEDTKFRMREFRLANGLRVIVEEDHAAPLVGVVTVVGVGSAGDPTGKAGLAHLLEHLAFRAKPGGKDTAWNQLERAGVGFLNASTSFDETIYMEAGSKDLLPQLLNIEMGRMLDPLNGVDATVFKVEREVVRNELRQRGENAVGPAFNVLQGLAFPADHPYSQPIGGSHASLDAITWDDARKFAVTHYRPDNMTMLIIGDVDLEHFDEVLKKALPSPIFAPSAPKAPWPSRLSARVEPPTPPPSLLMTTHAMVSTPELYVVWTLPRAFDSDTVMLDFTTVVANRELFEAARDPDIASIGIFPVAGERASMLVARAQLNRGDNPQRSAERILDQMVKLWSGDVGREYGESQSAEVMQKEFIFSRLRSQALVQMTVDAEALISRGVERANAAHFTGDPLTYSRRLRAFADVSPGQVSSYAEKYLKRDRARTLLVLPFASTDTASSGGAAGLAATADASKMAEVSVDDVLMLGRSQAARAKEMETVVRAKPDHLETTLANGLKVVVRKRRDSLPVAALTLTIGTGAGGTSPVGAAEMGELVASPRDRRYDGALGVSWSSRIGMDRSELSATGGAGNITNMLAQLSTRVRTMYVEGGELAYFKQNGFDALAATDQLPVVKGERALQAALFRGHVFEKRASLSEAAGLSASDIEGWYARAWTPERSVLVITGAIDPDSTMAEVHTWLDGWSKAGNPFPGVPAVTLRSGASEVVVTAQPSATQAQLHVACLVEGTSLQTELTAMTAASLVGTTLFEKVRGELGASYGISGRAQPLLTGQTRLDWFGAIENSKLGESLKVIRRVLTQFEQETLTDSSLGRARWAVARESTLDASTAPALADMISRHVLAGRKSTESESQWFEKLSRVDRESLQAQWKQCQGHMAVSLVGDEAVIRAAVSSSGW